MTSLILTLLYLAKDTVNRWFTRASSPLARVLVVFFLSLCALCFLGSYVISAKVIRDRIISEGGDMVTATVFPAQEHNAALPTAQECERLFGAESLAAENIGAASVGEKCTLPVFTFDFRRSAQMLPLMAGAGRPTLLCPHDSPLPEGPADVRFSGQETLMTVAVRHLPQGHLAACLLPRGGILVHPDEAEHLRPQQGTAHGVQHIALRLHRLESAEDLRRAETYFHNLLRLEGVSGSVSSASRLLGEMDIVLGNQMQCRATFCLGIVAIVGILLTALAGMEYRQNEYIYTLMKSFGIHPLLLVLTFIAENMVLVGVSFYAAVQTFMSCQVIIVRQFFKTASYTLSLEEIMPEIRLIAAALLVCIAVSALPIIAAAQREIGRVLK